MYSNLRSWPVFSSLEPKSISKIHMVMVFGELGKRALIVTKDKKVYLMNDNLHALESRDKSSTMLYPKEIKDLCGKDIKTFAYGRGSHILALTNGGEVYSCDNIGQLKNGTFNMDLTFTLINIPIIQDSQNMKHVVDIACGNKHSIILTKNDKVYAWESNNSGQVGNSTDGFSITPKFILSNVGCISCGDNFTMAVTKNGKVYGWGSNDVGQLGIGNYESKNMLLQTMQRNNTFSFGSQVTLSQAGGASNFENKNTPQLVGIPESLIVDKVTCGSNHTLVLTDKGTIYAWGGNKFGQLGIGNQTEFYTPTMVDIGQMKEIRWIDIAALNNTSIAVTEAGRFYVWGDCRGECISIPIATSSFNVHDIFGHYGPSIMHKPLILNEKLDILGCLGIAFDDSSTSDLKIQVEDKCIYVHKVILTICSSHFRKMFARDWAENQGVVNINTFSYVVYKAYLKYLYTNIINLPFKNISEFFDLANAYCEDNLKKQCIYRIKQEITVSNVAYFYNFAMKYETEELREFCVRFAVTHMRAVVKTENFAKLEDEKLMNRFINEASKAGCFKH